MAAASAPSRRRRRARTDRTDGRRIGGPLAIWSATARRAAASFASARKLLADYPFERQVASARVVMEPLGVAGLITPWNPNIGFICSKLSMAIAAGSTAVDKPSELSARQTALLSRVLHSAERPPGLFNIVTGRGATVGAEIPLPRWLRP